MRRSLLVALLLAFAVPVFAQEPTSPSDEVGIISSKRLSFGVGANYAWHSGDVSNLPTFVKEWEGGVYAAYNIVGKKGTATEPEIPSLSLVGSSVYGVDNRTFRSSLGLRLTLFNGAR